MSFFFEENNVKISANLLFCAAIILSSPAAGYAVSLDVLVHFEGPNGASPYGGLTIGSNGAIYGTTEYGGTFNNGTLFKYDGSLTTLVNFESAVNGSDPTGNLTFDALGNNLYGTTIQGGTNNQGTLYKYDGTSVTTLVNFSNFVNGGAPYAGVTFDGEGNFYGTTAYGSLGSNPGAGTIFKYDGSNLTTLKFFDQQYGPLVPIGGVTLDDDGNLYGGTDSGGAFGYGTLYKYDGTTHALTTLVDFDYTNGAGALSSLTFDGEGNLYGTTHLGGGNLGTLFKYDGSSLTTLVNFDYTNGSYPLGGVTFDGEGNLYGTTTQGGAYGGGTLFKYDGSSLTTLANFGHATNGSIPIGSVTFDSLGNLYGTTNSGGEYGYGTLYRLNFDSVEAVPEPSTFMLFGLGAAGMAIYSLRRRRTQRLAA